MQERDFAEWSTLSPKRKDIFPFLDEEGILPWEDWREFIPNIDELFPETDETLLTDCAEENTVTRNGLSDKCPRRQLPISRKAGSQARQATSKAQPKDTVIF